MLAATEKISRLYMLCSVHVWTVSADSNLERSGEMRVWLYELCLYMFQCGSSYTALCVHHIVMGGITLKLSYQWHLENGKCKDDMVHTSLQFSFIQGLESGWKQGGGTGFPVREGWSRVRVRGCNKLHGRKLEEGWDSACIAIVDP